MEIILGFLMNKFGLAAIVAALGGLAYVYRSVKSGVDVRREQAARKAAEDIAESARQQARKEQAHRAVAETRAVIEGRRNEALTAQLKAEREQKAREESIDQQEPSDVVGSSLDHLFDVPDGVLPGGAAGTDASFDDSEK